MIVLEGVSKTYDGGAQYSVHDVSLRIDAGQLLALVGTSGSGKTTTLKMINRLIEPSAGRIEVGGRDVRARDPVTLRREIGYVFQGIGLFPHMTIAENIAVVPRLLKWPKARISARVDELLELVHLPPDQYRQRVPIQLSGGQQQRVGFARALASGPAVMLLDEPFGALDPVTRDELRGEFIQIRRRLGLTAVLVTHDMTEALLTADRIAVMRGGKLLRVDTPHRLMTEHSDPFVTTLMSGPRRNAQQLDAIISNGRNGKNGAADARAGSGNSDGAGGTGAAGGAGGAGRSDTTGGLTGPAGPDATDGPVGPDGRSGKRT